MKSATNFVCDKLKVKIRFDYKNANLTESGCHFICQVTTIVLTSNLLVLTMCGPNNQKITWNVIDI